MDAQQAFGEIKDEYLKRGVPFRWCLDDARESFSDSVYIVAKSVRKYGLDCDFCPKERLFFNNFFVRSEEELLSYLAFNLARNSGILPDSIHAKYLVKDVL
jgi:hypothetical protein